MSQSQGQMRVESSERVGTTTSCIISAIRTAITKAKKGGFRDAHPELLLSHVRPARRIYTHSTRPRPRSHVGNVLPAGGDAGAARMAAIHSGIPAPAAVNTLNRQCSTGLTAITKIANQIVSGQVDIGIGAGVESMTKGYGPQGIPASYSHELKSAFSEVGSTHAGNASQVSDGGGGSAFGEEGDGAEAGVADFGQVPYGGDMGVPPRITGVGPAYAIPKVLENSGLEKSDIDLYEISEAFASQALYCVRMLGIPMEKVNVHGGAIAIGHFIGCTGARQVATGLNIAKQYGGRVFVTSMCIGSGMGMAAFCIEDTDIASASVYIDRV
ncbi:Thiolase, C-terminal domain-containing protein [Lyophyllum atratum]|nr:Thiolase, C-terminal domain-containing protein [Lyophyllum atratum]